MTINFPALPAFTLSLSRPASGDVSDATDTVLLIFTEDARLLAGARLFRPCRGDAFLLPPETPAFLYPEKNEARALRILLPTALLRTLVPRVLLASATGGAMLALQDPWEDALTHIEATDALAFFSFLSTITQACVVTDTRELPLPRCVRKALARLCECGSTSVEPKALASLCGVSESTLLRALRAHLSLTPRKYAKLVQNAHQKKAP